MENKEEMNPLKVGDKVYSKEHSRWRNDVRYRLEVVERINKTQAILSNGIRLINTPQVDYYSNKVCYPAYGDTWNKWSIQTPEILEEAKAEKERQSIISWFNDRKFSEEEKRIIYTTFKDMNILEAKNQEF